MAYRRYRELSIPDDDGAFRAYSFPGDRVLGPLSAVNLFVGGNNSGKSRMLRNLFLQLGRLRFTSESRDVQELTSFLENLKSSSAEALGVDCRFGPTRTFDELLGKNDRFLDPDEALFERASKLVDELASASDESVASTSYDENVPRQGAARLRRVGSNARREFDTRWESNAPFPTRRVYIPMLRGMRPLDPAKTDFYQDRTKKDYFTASETKANVGGMLPGLASIDTGMTFYEELKAQMLGPPDEREAVRLLEKFLSDNFFEGAPVGLTPRGNDDTVHLLMRGDQEYPIHQIGDGTQNLLVLVFSMLSRREPSSFFIEEPELAMHPGLQRMLINVMFDFAQQRGHQFFMTTHSNHLLDMTLDYESMAVFLFRRERGADEVEGAAEEAEHQRRFSVQFVSGAGASQALAALGVQNSSLFLTNATIWVEGVTDRRYIRQFLRRMAKGDGETAAAIYREDLHFSFVEYQGSNLEHWRFGEVEDESGERINADFLCGSAFLVADGDIESKGDRLARYQEMLGEKIYPLPCKEIENLLPQEVVRSLVAEEFSAAGVDVETILYSEYASSMEGLGKYLDDKLGKPGAFGELSGTLKGKVDFCDKAVALLAKDEWGMTEQIETLCGKIFDHVANRNR